MDHTPYLIGFTIMSLASLAIYAKGSKEPAIRHHTYFHATVPFIAATSYLAMFFDVGAVLPPNEVLTPIARYADWTITTPILLAGLIMAGLHEHGRPAGFMVAALTLDALMIAAGLISSLATVPEVRIVFYVWSCAAFAGVLYVLWGPVRTISRAEGGPFHGAFVRNLAFLSVVWFLYPLVFAVGPEGSRTLDPTASAWAILLLDVVAKVVYGFYAGANVEHAAAERRA